MRRARSVRVAVAATLAGVLVMAGTGSDAFDGDGGRLQAAVDEVHGYGITGVQGLTDVDGRVTTARAGVASLATEAPVPLFAPGTSWSYSNTNHVLAGMIINRVTGHSWAREVHDRILAPLHLNHTYVPGEEPTLRNPHADGYNQFAPGGPLVDTTLFNPAAADAAGAMISTPTDLARFWQALQGGRLLAPSQMAQMHKTVPEPDLAQVFPGARYGLGIRSIQDSCGGYWAHAGEVPGMITLNGVSPDGKRVVVLSMSTELADQARTVSADQRAQKLIDDTLCSR